MLREQVKEYSGCIEKLLFNFDLYICCDNLLLYSDYRNEVMTSAIFEHACRVGKAVFYPKVKDDMMDFYKVNSLEELKPGSFGILEPLETGQLFGNSSKCLMLLPLSAFDRKGARIGYGGGYYDRYLEDRRDIIKVGLAYSFQEEDSIPLENTDIRLDYIITEKEIIEVDND